jgi:Phage head-tail joining protein
MLAFQSWELEADREEMEESLPDTAIVMRAIQVEDPDGGTTNTYASVTGLEAVPCRVIPRSTFAAERVEGGALEAVTYWEILVPWDTVIIPTDRLIVRGVTYEVNDGGAPDRSQSLVLVLNCRSLA